MVLFYETEQINSLFFLHLLHTSEQLCNISIQVHKRSAVENGFFHHSSTSHNLCSSIHPLRKEQPRDAAEGAQPQTVQLQGGLDAPGETGGDLLDQTSWTRPQEKTSWTGPQEKTSWTRPPRPNLLGGGSVLLTLPQTWFFKLKNNQIQCFIL